MLSFCPKFQSQNNVADSGKSWQFNAFCWEVFSLIYLLYTTHIIFTFTIICSYNLHKIPVNLYPGKHFLRKSYWSSTLLCYNKYKALQATSINCSLPPAHGWILQNCVSVNCRYTNTGGGANAKLESGDNLLHLVFKMWQLLHCQDIHNIHPCSSLLAVPPLPRDQTCISAAAWTRGFLKIWPFKYKSYEWFHYTFCSLFCQKWAYKSCSYKAGELDTLW